MQQLLHDEIELNSLLLDWNKKNRRLIRLLSKLKEKHQGAEFNFLKNSDDTLSNLQKQKRSEIFETNNKTK